MKAARILRVASTLVLTPLVVTLASCEPAGNGPVSVAGAAEVPTAEVPTTVPAPPPSAPLVTTTGPAAPQGPGATDYSGLADAISADLAGLAIIDPTPSSTAPALRPAAAGAPTTTTARAAAASTTRPAGAVATTRPPVATAPPTTAPLPATVAGVGDSIMLSAKSRLQALPGWTFAVDAVVGRQFTTGIPLLATAAATKPSYVVLGLGTNGPVTDAQFDQAMKNLAGVPKVVVVTVQLPDGAYPHEPTTNDVLRRGAARWGAVVADWNAVSSGHAEAFGADGYHLSPAGIDLYVSMMANTLAAAKAAPSRA